MKQQLKNNFFAAFVNILDASNMDELINFEVTSTPKYPLLDYKLVITLLEVITKNYAKNIK